MQDSKNFNLGLSEERLKGVEAFHLKFNKAVAGVGTAYPLCSPGISLHTYNLPEWFYRLGFSQAHRWYNREDREKELGVVLETLPVQRAVSFPSCPPHDVMMTTGLSWICVQSSGAPCLGCPHLTRTQAQECSNNFPPPAQTWHLCHFYPKTGQGSSLVFPQTLSGSAQR